MELATIFAIVSSVHGLPDGLLSSICMVESAHRPMAVRMDTNGLKSIGLCQIQLRTARHMGFKGKEKELYDAYINAYWAGAYIKFQHNRYTSWIKTIKAYNAGFARNNKPNSYYKKVIKANLNKDFPNQSMVGKSNNAQSLKEGFYECSETKRSCVFRSEFRSR